MASRRAGATRRLTRQLVVRVDDELYADLEAVALPNERTIAQEVRLRLRRGLGLGVLAAFGLGRR